MQEMIKRAKELLADKTVSRVFGWKQGDLPYNPEPAVFQTEIELNDMVYNSFCSANLSKYLIEAGNQEGRSLIFLKPCDTYSFNQLLKENCIRRENTYVIAVGCDGNVDMDKLLARKSYNDKACADEDVLLERCKSCKGSQPVVYDECIQTEFTTPPPTVNRFALVEELERMSAVQRYEFWQEELSKCIRCNACRNVCPACTCRQCVFDSDKFDAVQKANSDSFEEKMFHIIRALHVAGRCTDCGECSRVCPQGIPFYLLNRKMIKDINEFYGEYQAGLNVDSKGPLTDFTMEDIEPGMAGERG